MSEEKKESLKDQSIDKLLQQHTLEELEDLLGMKVILSKFPAVVDDPNPNKSGVLLRDEIEDYAKKFNLICPFNPDNLKGASCRLTVGTQYALGGKDGRLLSEPGKNELKIPPFEVAVIRTGEIINMPYFLIGRWNIRVTAAYEGLLWVGGPQVDPGWIGYLFCPIYNLSAQEITLKKGQAIAVIDFIKTTTLDKELVPQMMPRPPKRLSIEDYKPYFRSALFTEVAQRIDQVESIINNQVESRIKRIEAMAGLFVTVLAICIATVAIFVTSTQGSESTVSIAFSAWLYISIALSIIAIVLALAIGRLRK